MNVFGNLICDLDFGFFPPIASLVEFLYGFGFLFSVGSRSSPSRGRVVLSRLSCLCGSIDLGLIFLGVGIQFRVTEEAENLGVDVAEHGEEAYAERVGSPQLY